MVDNNRKVDLKVRYNIMLMLNHSSPAKTSHRTKRQDMAMADVPK